MEEQTNGMTGLGVSPSVDLWWEQQRLYCTLHCPVWDRWEYSTVPAFTALSYFGVWTGALAYTHCGARLVVEPLRVFAVCSLLRRTACIGVWCTASGDIV